MGCIAASVDRFHSGRSRPPVGSVARVVRMATRCRPALTGGRAYSRVAAPQMHVPAHMEWRWLPLRSS